MGVVVVVLLNLLIAIMGDSYEKVKESERVEALRERAQIIVEAERTHQSWHKYHRYMHFVEAADLSEPRPQEWEGITGRVKQLLDDKVCEVQHKIEDKIDKKNDEMTAKIMDIKAEMRGIKDLLATMTSTAKYVPQGDC